MRKGNWTFRSGLSQPERSKRPCSYAGDGDDGFPRSDHCPGATPGCDENEWAFACGTERTRGGSGRCCSCHPAHGRHLCCSISHRLHSTLYINTTTGCLCPDPARFLPGQTYKVGMVLPQEVGNCLQCVCVQGPSAEEPARVTCSPHNCPPLILPDLFDTTGY